MIIDVHGHLSSPEAVRRFPMPASLGDVEGMIERKLEHGVGLTIVGSPVGAGAMVPVPGVDNFRQPADRLARLHEWLAATVQRYPAHLRGYVYLNPLGGDAELNRAAATVRAPEFVGFIVNSSVRGQYLVGPEATDFFAMVAESGLPMLVHAPAAPAAGTGLTDLRLIEQLGRFCDVTAGVAAIVVAGWLERYPSLRLIAVGGGGALALLPERLDLAASSPHWGPPEVASTQLAAQPSQYLRQLWVDTATPSVHAHQLNIDVFGADRVLFGTDSPPLSMAAVTGPIRALAELPLEPATREAVFSGNAVALFADRLPGDLVPAVASRPSART
jgi:aminocarboxymuconate-semialdehyde decarboxylase